MRIFCLLSLLLLVLPARSESLLSAVQIYSQDELLELIAENKHLKRVRDDECQLVEDIKARSTKMKVPAYQFLYGDMLLYGVCVKKDARLGMHFVHRAAEQGLPEALEQLGRYYAQGKFIRANKKEAVYYFYRAASVGHLNAQMQLIDLYLEGYGGPSDYYYAYHWLHNALIADSKEQKKATQLLAKLAKKMPDALVEKAKQPLER